MENKEAFESWYAEKHIVRQGARGRSSKNLTVHENEYISDHARECFEAWCAALNFQVKGE